MATTMANTTLSHLPALPLYTLTPREPTIPGIPDIYLQLLAPVVVYWLLSLLFEILDYFDLFPQYRLHTPAEVLKRNHVSRSEVAFDVVVQQIIQTLFGLGMAAFDPPEMVGKEQYDIAKWAQRLRIVQKMIPTFLATLGINGMELSSRIASAYPTLAAILAGGNYSSPGFAPWELIAGQVCYWILVPFVQFVVAICMVDTWQYFLHRAMHMNKFLYTTLHSRHHRLYVPYAFGALYNHPIEGFLLDTLGTGLAYLVTGMTVMQGTWFFTCSTIKTVDDHCGYAFPWDPLQHVTENNAAYHDVHHQSWGIKTNFSQPFFTFWDRFLGTSWSGGDISARYERDRISAQKKVDAEKKQGSVVNTPVVDPEKARKQAAASQRQVLSDKENGGPVVLEEERKEEIEAIQNIRRTPRRRTSGFDAKAFSDRMTGKIHSRSTPILHADGMH